jgi:hypothetical protein
MGPLVNVHYPGSPSLVAASRLNPQVAGLGGGRVPWVEGDRSIFHMGQAGQSSTVHQLLLYGTLNTTAHLTDRSGPLTPKFFLVGHI